MNIVAILGFTSWAASVNRTNHTDDRFAQYALATDRIDELVIATPFRSAPIVAARKLMGERVPPFPAGAVDRTSLFEPKRLRRKEPTDRPGMLRSARRYSDLLGKHVRAQGVSDPHVIVFNPYIAGLADFEWATSTTYYSVDDYAEGTTETPWRDVLHYSYEGIKRRRRPTAAVAPILLRRIDSDGPQIVLPNGVDPAAFGIDHPQPAWMRDLPRPIAIYSGIIDDRLEPTAVRQIAAAIPFGTVLIVGRVTEVGLEASLADVPNVHFAGLQPPGDVASIVSNSDVALLPHRVTDVTRGMSPLKVFEALGAGLPVVATDLEPVRGVTDRIFLVPEGGDFGAATLRAVARGKADADEREQLIHDNSWATRFDALLDFATGSAPARL